MSTAQELQTIKQVEPTTIEKDWKDFNPIVFLNVYAHKFKIINKPKYIFSKVNQAFTCSLEFHNQRWNSQIPRKKKKETKQDVARMAMTDLEAQIPEQYKRIDNILRTAHVLKPKKKYFGDGVKQIAKNLHTSDLRSKVVVWYIEQQKCNLPKPPRVLILELCQMYCLGQPEFKEILNKSKSPGLHFFSIGIGNDTWYPNTGFHFKPDAKDHVANLAFSDLYEKIRKLEIEEIDAKVLEHEVRTGQTVENPEELNKKSKTNSYIEDIRETLAQFLGFPCKIVQECDKQEAILAIPILPIPILPQGIDILPTILPPPPPTSPPSTNLHQPYPKDRPRKSFVSLLHEISARHKWDRPKYVFHNSEGGCSAEVHVNGKTYFTGRFYPRKADAKADVSQHVCSLLE